MWSNKEKSNAIRQLVINLGDIPKTAAETKIAERTLLRWKNELQREGSLIYWEQDSLQQILRHRYDTIRMTMLVQIERMLNQMASVPPRHLPHFVTAISRLTDRLEGIENILENTGQYHILVSIPPDSPQDQQEE